MRRWIVSKPGGHSALELVEEPDRSPGPGEVAVRAKACGVNYADVIVRLGYYSAAKGLYPITPGFEYAGVVEACGRDVRGFVPGDRVVGITRFGGYASRIVAPEAQLWPIPEGWGFADAAAFPAVYMTAYYGLFKTAKIEKGETVLVHSAAGGMGVAILQLAKIAGCPAIAVVGSPKKAALCRELGAEAVIDRSTQDLWAEVDRLRPNGVDVILDANGVTTPRPGFQRLAQGGRLVIYGFAEIMTRGAERPSRLSMAWRYLRVPKFSPLEMTGANRGVLGFNVVYLFHKAELAREGMARLFGWVREGLLDKPRVTAFPFADAAKAHAALESGATTGKLALVLE